jgi:hypothetical protein
MLRLADLLALSFGSQCIRCPVFGWLGGYQCAAALVFLA